MPLDAVNFHPLGPVKSVDLMQFYNLLTGVMQDQPITSRNALSIGGNQGQTTVPLKVYGAVGQNTNLIDLYVDRTAAQPGFGFSATGTIAWGPGGVAPQDTFMSRIALQNGHSTDTPGLLVTPLLEIAGMLTSTRMVVPNGAAFPTVNPPPVNGDLYYRHDLNKLYVYDASAAAWVTGAAAFDELAYGTYNHGTATTYVVPPDINMVFVSANGATVQLPAPSAYGPKAAHHRQRQLQYHHHRDSSGWCGWSTASPSTPTRALSATASSPRQPAAWTPSPTSRMAGAGERYDLPRVR